MSCQDHLDKKVHFVIPTVVAKFEHQDPCYWRGDRSKGSRIHFNHPGYSQEQAREFGWAMHFYDDMRSIAATRTICDKKKSHCNVTHQVNAVNCATCLRKMRDQGILEKEAGRALSR